MVAMVVDLDQGHSDVLGSPSFASPFSTMPRLRTAAKDPRLVSAIILPFAMQERPMVSWSVLEAERRALETRSCVVGMALSHGRPFATESGRRDRSEARRDAFSTREDGFLAEESFDFRKRAFLDALVRIPGSNVSRRESRANPSIRPTTSESGVRLFPLRNVHAFTRDSSSTRIERRRREGSRRALAHPKRRKRETLERFRFDLGRKRERSLRRKKINRGRDQLDALTHLRFDLQRCASSRRLARRGTRFGISRSSGVGEEVAWILERCDTIRAFLERP